jgi:hypothetical protein
LLWLVNVNAFTNPPAREGVPIDCDAGPSGMRERIRAPRGPP